jgi:hypothetical protein
MTLRLSYPEFDPVYCELLRELLKRGPLVGASLSIGNPLSHFWTRGFPSVTMAEELMSLLPEWQAPIQQVVAAFEHVDVVTWPDPNVSMTFCRSNGALSLVAQSNLVDAWVELVVECFCLSRLQGLVSAALGAQLGDFVYTIGRVVLSDPAGAERALRRQRANPEDLDFDPVQVTTGELIARATRIKAALPSIATLGELEKVIDDAEIFGTEVACCLAQLWVKRHDAVGIDTSLIPRSLCCK